MTALIPGCVAACPGCGHRHLSGAQSRGRKQAFLARTLAPWAERLAPVRGAVTDLGYRQRVCLAAAWEPRPARPGRPPGWQLGLKRDERVVPIPHCPVHAARVNTCAGLLAAALPPPQRFPLVYLVQAGAQLTLVVKARTVEPARWLDRPLTEALAAAGLEGLWLHRFPAVGRQVFAKGGWDLLWGRPRSRDADGLTYGPTAFAQALPHLARRALDRAEAFLAPGPGDRLIDLYSGRGAGLARWRDRGAQTLGVELGGEAVACAEENLPGVTVLRGACAQRLPQLEPWAAAVAAERRLAYVNPPRTGLEPAVAQWLAQVCRPRRLAYLSCSAGTLARDLAVFQQAGYRVAALEPWDFFPRTPHGEVLALLRL